MQSQRYLPRLTLAIAILLSSTIGAYADEAAARFKRDIVACLGFREFKVARDDNGAEFLQVVYGLDLSTKPEFERELEAIRDRLDHQGYHLHFRWYAHAKDSKGRIRELRGNGGGALIPAKFKVTSDSSFDRFFGEREIDEVTWTFTIDYDVIDKPADNPSRRQVLSDSGIASCVVSFTRSRDGEKLKYSARVLDGRDAKERKVAREELVNRLKDDLAQCLSLQDVRVAKGEDGAPFVEVVLTMDLSKNPELERRLQEIRQRVDSNGYHLHYNWVARTTDKTGRTKEVRQSENSALMPATFKDTYEKAFETFFREIDADDVTWTFSFDFYVVDKPLHLPGVRRITEAKGVGPREVKFTRTHIGDKLDYTIEMLEARRPTQGTTAPTQSDANTSGAERR